MLSVRSDYVVMIVFGREALFIHLNLFIGCAIIEDVGVSSWNLKITLTFVTSSGNPQT